MKSGAIRDSQISTSTPWRGSVPHIHRPQLARLDSQSNVDGGCWAAGGKQLARSANRGVWGGNAWERRSHTFFTFCFEMSLKLLSNAYFWVCVPTPFLLALHP